jgi:hypothetical protein
MRCAPFSRACNMRACKAIAMWNHLYFFSLLSLLCWLDFYYRAGASPHQTPKASNVHERTRVNMLTPIIHHPSEEVPKGTPAERHLLHARLSG